MVLDTPSIDSSPNGPKSPGSAVAGVKRPAPSLLPAFEPFPSSPTLPRPSKRINRESPPRHRNVLQKYPTPLPTSSTGIISSSPPHQSFTRRPGLSRTASAFSERVPLSTVPSIELDEHGEPTLMGRSSNSSHYQLSTNKLISRVHVRAVYIAADPPAPNKIQVQCMGWNGVKVHCQGRAWELRKGDSFTSETEDADIMVDVQDARVLLQWPRDKTKPATPAESNSTWDENSPRRVAPATQRSPFSSPLRQQNTPRSPISPSPAVQAAASRLTGPNPSDPGPVQVYEDDDAKDEADRANGTQATQVTQIASQAFLGGSQSSVLSELNELSDNDEENDPVVHSFGPFGANLGRRMERFTANDSPEQRRAPLSPLKASSISPQRQRRSESTHTLDEEATPIVNHAVNQLAYSRLASTPLSTILGNLPLHLKGDSPGSKENGPLKPEDLKRMLDATPCIGEVPREGKDAAGKPLESEFYYVPDFDTDENRRNAVVEGLRKPGLRACRKQHKVFHSSIIFSLIECIMGGYKADLARAILLAETQIGASFPAGKFPSLRKHCGT
ncbi:MAG: hypothetical protein Q9214_003195 [Letrouitia sp. 1 TL-2023]